MKKIKMRRAVKESFDDLPCGVSFFDKNGFIVLCNLQMQRIIYALSGHDMQGLFDLQQFLEKKDEVWRLSDGTVWRFEQKKLENYIQVTASDVTRLHKLCKELELENHKLMEEGKRIRELSEHVMEIMREEEILNAKMEIHKQFGDGLAKLRRCLREGRPIEEFDVSQWKRAIRFLQHESEVEEGKENIEKLEQLADSIGVHICGDIIWDNSWCLLAVRECVTNTARHAEGDQVNVRCEETKEEKILSITNNGRRPQEVIVEGGGLASLRNCVEKMGGKMSVQTTPVFLLSIHMPKTEGEKDGTCINYR